MTSIPTALYIHVPFCLQRCTYCDFNTYAGLLHLRAPYVEAVLTEMRHVAETLPAVRATTLYFGGGTPALLAPADVGRLITAAQRWLALPSSAEITLEANPGVCDAPRLDALLLAGVNRLSLGVQAFHPAALALLGRIHTWEEAAQTVQHARAGGWRNLSLDLIFGLPRQTLAQWQRTLVEALALGPEHLSLYGLTVEPGTPLAETLAVGALPAPDPDLAAEMYLAASEILQDAGFWQYEISNWARGVQPAPEMWSLPPGGETEQIGPAISQHNLVYWRNTPWIGLGAGAHTWFAGQRWANVAHPREYIAALEAQRAPLAETETISPALERGETLMLGLRLAEGVGAAQFQARFGLALEATYAEEIRHWRTAGLLTWEGARLRLQRRGRLLGNQVFGAFLPD